MKSKILISLITILAVSSIAGATFSYDVNNIEYSAGTGVNSATIVIDFDYDNYFTFTFRWNDGDSHTGWDALDSLDTAGDLDVSATDYGSWGMFVNDFSYPNGNKYPYSQSENTSWAYYISTDNNSWAISSNGVSFRTLNNGDYDSWVWTNYDENWSPVRTPGTTPVPEPITVILFSLGGLLIKRTKV